MRTAFLILIACLFLSAPLRAESFHDRFPDALADLASADQQKIGAMVLQGGTVTLGDGLAQIAVPEGYYLLRAADAQYIAANVWSEPADPNLLALIAPDDVPMIGASGWIAAIRWLPVGHIAENDVWFSDHDTLLAQIQAKGGNTHRLEAWAMPPFYLPKDQTLVWSGRFSQNGAPLDGMTYEARILGRDGVLALTLMTASSNLPIVRKAEPALARAITFLPGHGYADYQEGKDPPGTHGIAWLIAGAAVQPPDPAYVIWQFVRAIAPFVIIVLGLIQFLARRRARLRT